MKLFSHGLPQHATSSANFCCQAPGSNLYSIFVWPKCGKLNVKTFMFNLVNVLGWKQNHSNQKFSKKLNLIKWLKYSPFRCNIFRSLAVTNRVSLLDNNKTSRTTLNIEQNAKNLKNTQDNWFYLMKLHLLIELDNHNHFTPDWTRGNIRLSSL